MRATNEYSMQQVRQLLLLVLLLQPFLLPSLLLLLLTLLLLQVRLPPSFLVRVGREFSSERSLLQTLDSGTADKIRCVPR